jgi:hypothetical protein
LLRHFPLLIWWVVAFSASRGFGDTVGYWRFEEGTAGTAASGFSTILDSSGYGNNGTPVNGPVYSSNVPVSTIPQTGASNSLAMSFNGTDQRIFIPDSTSLALTQSFTLEAYIDPTTTSGGSQDIIFRGDDRVALDPYKMFIGGNDLTVSISDASGDLMTLSASFTAVNTWSFVAATLNNATGSLDLYVNGSMVASTVTTIRPFATLDPAENPGLGIGNTESSNYSEWFSGLIDEVRISNVPLTPSQMLDAPEPSCCAAMALGSALLLRRRRRAENAS